MTVTSTGSITTSSANAAHKIPPWQRALPARRRR
jgi:hypothetical protein